MIGQQPAPADEANLLMRLEGEVRDFELLCRVAIAELFAVVELVQTSVDLELRRAVAQRVATLPVRVRFATVRPGSGARH